MISWLLSARWYRFTRMFCPTAAAACCVARSQRAVEERHFGRDRAAGDEDHLGPCGVEPREDVTSVDLDGVVAVTTDEPTFAHDLAAVLLRRLTLTILRSTSPIRAPARVQPGPAFASIISWYRQGRPCWCGRSVGSSRAALAAAACTSAALVTVAPSRTRRRIWTDHDRVARDGAGLNERIADPEASQPVREVADGLAVLEVGLRDPALGPRMRKMVP